jgi:hypothetical protein
LLKYLYLSDGLPISNASRPPWRVFSWKGLAIRFSGLRVRNRTVHDILRISTLSRMGHGHGTPPGRITNRTIPHPLRSSTGKIVSCQWTGPSSPSAQLDPSAMQVIDAQDSQRSGCESQELEGHRLAPAQNFHLDGSHWQWHWQPSGLSSLWEHWEECIRRFAAARQETGRPSITISFWDRKNEKVERSS